MEMFAEIICSKKWTVFWECSLRETASFEKQILYKEKHPRIFSPQMETIVFIIKYHSDIPQF